MYDREKLIDELEALGIGESASTVIEISEDVRLMYEVWRNQGGQLECTAYEISDLGVAIPEAETLVDRIEGDIVDRQAAIAFGRLDKTINEGGTGRKMTTARPKPKAQPEKDTSEAGRYYYADDWEALAKPKPTLQDWTD